MLHRTVIGAICFSVLCALSFNLMLSGNAGDTRVADAAEKGDTKAVRALIREAADVNSAQGDGMTALHWAALNGDAELASVLLYSGANLRATTRLGGYTPLFMAAKSGHAKVIDALLKAGADAKVKAVTGLTPLMMASSSGDAESVRLLAEAGADVNARETGRGQTALSFAAAFNRPDAIRMLLKMGADVNLASFVVAPMAVPQRGAQGGQQSAVPAVPGAPAAQAGEPAGQRGIPAPEAAANQPAAGTRGQRGGANPAPAGAPAAQPQQQQQMNEDAGRGGGNPKGKLTPLMYASREGQFDAVRALVEGGANLNLLNGDNSTALLLTTMNGHFDIAKYLVEQGADVNLASMDGATPLYVVANVQWARKSFHPQPTTKYEQTTYLELMTAMLDKGADPNYRLTKELWYTGYNFSLESSTAAGTTAFWKCAAVGDIDGMRLLISRGADPNIASVEGVTPLLMAAGAGVHGNDDISAPSGRLNAIKYMVEELHADVNVADTGPAAPPAPAPQPAAQGTAQAQQPQQQQQQQQGFGRASGGFTALHNAAARGDNAMILYLVSKGARVDAVAKNGASVADMANGPRQRIQPYPETVALLEMLGSKNSHKCISC